jgi:adenylate cyclase
MRFRIGLNLGDVIEEDDGTIYGDGVNIAARMEALADEGGICISSTIHDAVEGKLDFGFDFLGERPVKNIEKPVRVYRVRGEPGEKPKKPTASKNNKLPLIMASAVLVVAIAGVSIWQSGRGPASEETKTAAADDPVLALPTGPTIAVLPFSNMSGDPEQDYFVDGLTEQLIGSLARFQNIQVIARNSTSKYKGQAVDVRDVGRDLGATYVLEGSIRRDRNTVRVTAQLIDAGNGVHLWAETYERDLSAASIFAIQDGITAQVASIVAGHSGVIARQLVRTAAGRRTDDLAAYECVLLAYKYDRVATQDTYLAARGCLEKAIERDPNYAEALGALSYIYADGYQMGLAENDSSIDFLAEAYRLAFRAVELAPTSAGAQRQLAMAYFYNGEVDGFREHAERALTLNPHDPTSLGMLGTFIGATGDFARGGPLVHKAFALNADLPYWYKFTFAGEHYWKGEWEAGRVLMEGLDTSDDNPFTHHWHLLFLGELGLRDRATEVLARLRKITPSVSIAEFGTLWAKFNPPAGHMERYAASWRKAGVPEEPPKTAKTVESKK